MPRTPSVCEILEQYQSHLRTVTPAVASLVDSATFFVAGVKDYFNDALPRILLYKAEFAQVCEFFALILFVVGVSRMLRLTPSPSVLSRNTFSALKSVQ
jgi:hypothetical protein